MLKSVLAIVGTSRVQPRSTNAPTSVAGPPSTRGNDRKDTCTATGESSRERPEIASASCARVTGWPAIDLYLTRARAACFRVVDEAPIGARRGPQLSPILDSCR